MLVRGGVRDLLICDGDSIEAGNLVRHTLSLADLGKLKASALAAHLNGISPHARVESIDKPFPDGLSPADEKKLDSCDIIYDCSATDIVLRELGRWKWSTDKILLSLSLGFGAERLYLISGHSGADYLDILAGAFKIELQMDKEMLERADLPAEAAGCWHPLFPARIDRIWSLVGIALNHVERIVVSGETGFTAILIKWADEQVAIERKKLK
jgi:hypothetical protein